MDSGAVTAGAAGAAQALQSGFTADAIWNAITPFLGVVITITLVSLSIYFMRRITKKAGKGKGGL